MYPPPRLSGEACQFLFIPLRCWYPCMRPVSLGPWVPWVLLWLGPCPEAGFWRWLFYSPNNPLDMITYGHSWLLGPPQICLKS